MLANITDEQCAE